MMDRDDVDLECEWRPTATSPALRRRAALLADIRQFFAARDVLEVETPVLSSAGTVDPHIESVVGLVPLAGAVQAQRYFLHTSPEFAMKRLLAAGSGSIYQLCKVFRGDEQGRWHNPEFTLLEWYRVGFDHHQLMDEMDGFLAAVGSLLAAERLSYRAAFERALGVDPLTCELSQLMACAAAAGCVPEGDFARRAQRDDWLDLLMGVAVGPKLGWARPTFIYDYPASQAALARVDPGPPATARRFEVYVRGVELANGFHELTDANEQARRFRVDVARRRATGQPPVPPDERLLAALRSGVPPCAGVALGIDRLLMVLLDAASIGDVLAFPADRA